MAARTGHSSLSRTLGSLRTAFTAAVQHARVQRQAGINPFSLCPPGKHHELPGHFNPSKLDFWPRFDLSRKGRVVRYIGDEAGFKSSRPKCFPAKTEPCPVNVRQNARESLLKTWGTARLRLNPSTCPAHGTAAQMPFVGGNGGGSFRLDFDHNKAAQHAKFCHKSQWRQRQQYRAYSRCANPFSMKRHWGSSAYSTFHAHRRTVRGTGPKARQRAQRCGQAFRRTIRGLTEHVRYDRMRPTHMLAASRAGPALAADGCEQTRFSRVPQHQHRSPVLLRPPWSPSSGQAGKIRPPPPLLGFSSGLKLCCCPPSHSALHHLPAGLQPRSFSSSSRRSAAPAVAVAAAFKLGQLLKSASALGYINVLFRISVSFLPLAWRQAVHLRRAQARLTAAGAGAAAAAAGAGGIGTTLFRLACRGALVLPFVLLAAVLLASLERTPITGRWRLVLLNEQEERDIVSKVLDVGANPPASAGAVAGAGQRDWLSIMRAVLGEQEAPEGTLLGGTVLDPASDWRVGFVQRTLAKLEGGLPALSPSASVLVPPASAVPLGRHARSAHISQANANAVLVIDRPEANAFSFGFYGATDAPQPGVVIVFAGAVDEIMRSASGPGSPPAPGKDALELEALHDISSMELELKSDPSWLRAFMDSIYSGPSNRHTAAAAAAAARRRRGKSPTPTKEQEEALAVLLAHELAHLVLSHTIESYASTNLLYPQLEKLGWDLVRVLLYPVTALLGPFVQDAIAATVRVGQEESSGLLLPALTNSCESRALEYEADNVALRLLAGAGMDPRAALAFWEHRLAADAQDDAPHPREVHAHSSARAQRLTQTHPPDRERVAAIRTELHRWMVRRP